MVHRKWTEKEIRYLEKAYSKHGADYIAKKLHRSICAVRKKQQFLGLHSYFTENPSVYTVAGCFSSAPQTITRWIRMGLPCIEVKRGSKIVRHIRVEDFWTWAKQNTSIIPWHKYERYSLNPEPEWLDEVYQKRWEKKNHHAPWTLSEIREIVRLHENGMSYTELAKKTGRTERAVKHIYVDRNKYIGKIS